MWSLNGQGGDFGGGGGEGIHAGGQGTSVLSNLQVSASWRKGYATKGTRIYVASKIYGDNYWSPERLHADVGAANSCIIPVPASCYFRVRAVGYDSQGRLANYARSPYQELLIIGSDLRPPVVGNLHITAWASPSCTLAWNSISGPPDYIEIRVGATAATPWNLATVLTSTLAGTATSYVAATGGAGKYMVKAVKVLADGRKIYSLTEVSIMTGIQAGTVNEETGRHFVDAVDGNGRPIINFSSSHFNKYLDNIDDTTNYKKVAAGSVDSYARPLVDFSLSGHSNKTLDYIGDDANYSKAGGARGYQVLNSNNRVVAAKLADSAAGPRPSDATDSVSGVGGGATSYGNGFYYRTAPEQTQITASVTATHTGLSDGDASAYLIIHLDGQTDQSSTAVVRAAGVGGALTQSRTVSLPAAFRGVVVKIQVYVVNDSSLSYSTGGSVAIKQGSLADAGEL